MMLRLAVARPQVRIRLQILWLNRYAIQHQQEHHSHSCRRLATAARLRTETNGTSRKIRSKREATRHSYSRPEEPVTVDPAVSFLRQLFARSPFKKEQRDFESINGYLDDLEYGFKALRLKQMLSPTDTRTLTGSLLATAKAYRNIPRTDPQRIKVVSLAEQIVKDVRMGFLKCTPLNYMHVIEVLNHLGARESGILFWQWLRKEELDESSDIFIGMETYTAAIKLLMSEGATISELEEIYEEALKQYPGNFDAYHLSPNAIVPNRSQPVMHGQSFSSILQHSMIEARVRVGYISQAYMDLDTLFRLYPTGSNHISCFGAFLEKRPLREAYTVFALCCRAGRSISGTMTRDFIARLSEPKNTPNLGELVCTITATLNVMYLHSALGGKIKRSSVDSLILMLSRFTTLPGFGVLPSDMRKQISQAVIRLVTLTVEICAKFGIVPGPRSFEALIGHVAGHTSDSAVVTGIYSDMQKFGVEPDNARLSLSLINAAGLLGDQGLLKKTWSFYLELFDHANPPPFHAWKQMAIASHNVGETQYAEDEISSDLGRHLTDAELADFRLTLERGENDQSGHQSIDTTLLMEGLHKIAGDVQILGQKIDNGLAADMALDYRRLPMFLFPEDEPNEPSEVECRKLYDEYTKDSSNQKSAAAQPDSHLDRDESSSTHSDPEYSQTNIAFDVLRFENWRTLNALLKMAQKSEASSAIPCSLSEINREEHLPNFKLEGEADFQRMKGLGECFGENDVTEDTVAEITGRGVDEWVNEIHHLRGAPLGL